jgi:MATE family multidrug resistance protein
MFKTLLPELRKTIRLSLPIAIGQGGAGVLFVIDTAMAGHLGETPLAAAAFVGNLIILPFILGLGLASAVSVLTAQGRGAMRPEDGPAALRHGLFIAGIFGFSVGLGIHIAVRAGALSCFGQQPGVVEAAEDFAILLSWSTLPGLLFQCLKNHREAVSKPWVALRWVGAGVVFNLAFNWLFMFGNWGAPEMGLAGAGLGTLLGRSLSLLGLALSPGGQSPRWRDGIQLHWLRASLALGGPSALQWVLEVGVFSGAAVIMGFFGEQQQAAHQVAVCLANLAFMIPAGISQGTSIRVGEAFGARNPAAMRNIAAGALLFSMVFMGLYAIGVVIFREQIPLLFLGAKEVTPQTAVFATQFVLVAAAFALFDGLQVVASGALRGMSDVKFASLSSFICYWLVSAPIALPLAYFAGLRGVGIWIGLACGIAAAAFVLNSRLWWKLRKEQRECGG